ERVASVVSILAALECLSFDLPENREAFLSGLRPGQRVRLYPTGDVFQIGGITDGLVGMRMLRLHLTDAQSRRSHAAWLVPADHAFRFEPTLRRLPLGTATVRFGKLPSNDLDAIVGSQLFGYSALVSTLILFAGPLVESDR